MVHRSLSVTILTMIGLSLARRLCAHVRPLPTKAPAVTWLAARASVNSALRSASRAAPDGPHGEHALWQPHCCVRRYRSAFVSSRDRAACPSAPVAVWLVTDQLARARNPVPMYRGAGVRPTLNSPKRRLSSSLRLPDWVSNQHWRFTQVVDVPAARWSGCQIRFSRVSAKATARSSGMRPITKYPRPPRDQEASESSPRCSKRIGASGASLAMMQNMTGEPSAAT